MAWVILIASGLLEAVWAAAMQASKGFRTWRPTVLFVAAMLASMGGLAFAMLEIPTGTAYAVWTGIGAAGTVILGIILFKEPATVARLLCVGLILSGILGLKLLTKS